MITDEALHQILSRYWGFTELRPLQRAAIESIHAGRDSVVVLPTGGGKSLCYQIPALLDAGRAGVALVVSPLISLMKDQVDGMVASGVPAAAFNSALEPSERDRVLWGLRQGFYRLLYVSPERLVGESGTRFRPVLEQCGVRFIAIDEAHCISQWGHDFRPEYRQLAELRLAFPNASMHAFTATATIRVREDIVHQLALREPDVLVGSFDRPNLVYRAVARTALKEQTREALARHASEAGIIYCLSRKEVESVAGWLRQLGYRALPYHAGLDDETRTRHQEDFLSERSDVMVATVAFGMGIDRSNVRFVIHAGAPRSLEHYQQEAGRAGRDGLAAECLLIYSASDFLKWRRMLESHGELTDSAAAQLREMERYASGTRCRHRALVEYFGERYSHSRCGACDWCLGELERAPDAPVIAQKILSCVARLQQGWGIGHVVNVLQGTRSDAIAARGHDRLSTFGLLADCPLAELRGYVDQLCEQGLLRRTDGAFPVLQLAGEARAALRAEHPVALFRQPRPVHGRQRTPRLSKAEAASWAGVDRDLFDVLRGVRLRIARERGVPPYVVLHDSTLRDLARQRPSSLEQMRQVHGIGVRKAEDLGPEFLAAIDAYCAGHGLRRETDS
jgi:ATP-dependent DNA helicase RecQ